MALAMTSVAPSGRTDLADSEIAASSGGRVPAGNGQRVPWRWLAFAIFLIVLTSLFRPEPGAAQSLPLLPLEATINQNAVMRQELSPPPKRAATLRGRLGEPIAGVPPEKLEQTRLKLTAVEFEAPADVHLDPALLSPAWQGSIGKEISLRDFGLILEKIEDIYRQQDYVVIAQVPPQDFASGRIHVVASSVYVSEIEVKGVSSPGRLEPIFKRIKAMRPLRQSALYRQLLLAEDLVDGMIEAEWFQIANLRGAARLELNVTATPGTISLNFDNWGGQTTGPLQASARAHLHDVFGQFESTDFTALTNPADPQELVLLGVNQTLPIGTTGFSVGYGIANSWSDPSGTEASAGIHSQVLIANVNVNYALVREMERNLFVTASLNENNSSVDQLGEAVSRDRTRWVSLSAAYDDVWDDVGIILSPAFLQGIDAFQSNTQFDDFHVVTLNGGASTNLTDTLMAQLLFSGQYAFNDLPPAVLGFYGGEAFGKAFDPGALAGNSLVATSLQLTQRVDTDLPLVPSLNLFAFADYGAAWNSPGAPYTYASLSSLGFGVSATIADRLSVTGLVAQPLGYDSQLAGLGIDQSTRLRFTLNLSF